MRKLLCTAFIVSLVLGGAALSRADDKGDIKALLDKAIKASGGEAKLTKFKAVTFKAKGNVHIMGNAAPFTGEWAIMSPDRARNLFEVDLGGQKIKFLSVLSGDKGWRQIGESTDEMTKDQLTEAREQFHADEVNRLVTLKNQTLSPLGTIKIGDREAIGLKVSAKGFRDVSVYFDKETGLLSKTETRVKDEQSGEEVNQESFFTDYKEVQGVKTPMKLTVKRDSKLFIEAEITDYKLEEKLDDSVFAKPS